MSQSNEISPERREEAYEFLRNGKIGSEKDFRRKMYFGVQVWKQIKEDYKLTLVKRKRGRPKRVFDLPSIQETDENFDPIAYLNKQSKSVVEAIVRTSLEGNASSQKLWGQLTGKLVEKPLEVNIGFTADDIVRERRRAEEELRSKGVSEVRTELTVLPEHVRLHSEQEHSEDS